MVWPAKQNYHMFDGVIRNYTNAATITNSILCPVGKEWKEYFDRTGDFGYYSPDGFHPSLVGSTVAAEIIVQSLFKIKLPQQNEIVRQLLVLILFFQFFTSPS